MIHDEQRNPHPGFGESHRGTAVPSSAAEFKRAESTASLFNRHDKYNRGQLEYFRNEQPGNIPFTHDEIASMEEVPVTVEEPWTDRTEEILRDWQNQAETMSKLYQKAGYRIKFKYRLLGFILLFWSGIVLVVNGLVGCSQAETQKTIGLIVNAIQVFWTGLNSSMDLGMKYRVFFEYEAKYTELGLDIEYTLSRDRDFRIPADAFMTEMRERKKRLTEAPELPSSRFFFC